MSRGQKKADNRIHVCAYCGKEILDEPVMTRTKRGNSVYAHYECWERPIPDWLRESVDGIVCTECALMKGINQEN